MTVSLSQPAARRGLLALFAGLAMVPVAGLGGCAQLPSSGPTASAIVSSAHDPHAGPPFDIVDLTAEVVAAHGGALPLTSLAGLPAVQSVDAIGPGDVLQISIFEVGAGLFASHTTGEGPGASDENLPLITVDRNGQIAMPYLGLITVAGSTPNELAAKIQDGLAKNSQAPRVIVSIHDNIANTVMVIGDVKKPGRFPLTLAGERVLDAVADAGGPLNATPDNIVRLTRGAESAIASLATLHGDSPDDVALRPQDRVEVEYRPRTFTVFGATGKVQEMPFANPRVSLAEALARAGGPSDQQADPSSVFVFRYEPSAFDGAPLPGARPVAYRLNLLQAQSYLLAQRFEMKTRDVIYIPNAGSNQPAKMLQILNLFFQPFYTGKVISQ